MALSSCPKGLWPGRTVTNYRCSGMANSNYSSFTMPSPNYDFDPLIEALARVREQIELLQLDCGNRTPLYRAAMATLLDIDGLARLLPEGSSDQIIPTKPIDLDPIE